MNANEPKIADNLIERAVELWCRALSRPRFDNGDPSEVGGMASALATINAGTDIARAGDYEAAIGRFREILTAKCKLHRDKDGEPTGRACRMGRSFWLRNYPRRLRSRRPRSLHVSRHPRHRKMKR